MDRPLMKFGATTFAVLALLFVAAAPAAAATISFDFTNPGSGSLGTQGNELTFTADDGVTTLVATAWWTASGSSSSTFGTAALGWWATGLGVCNPNEGSCSGSELHQVDNIGQRDYVLFLFDASLQINSVTVDPFNTWDTDISYWLGNVNLSNIKTNLAGTAYTGLSGLGFGSENVQAGPTTANPVVHNLVNGGFYNALLIGTLRSDQGVTGFNAGNDRFKIASLTATTREVPEPASLLLLGLGFAAVAHRLRRRAGK